MVIYTQNLNIKRCYVVEKNDKKKGGNCLCLANLDLFKFRFVNLSNDNILHTAIKIKRVHNM